MSATIALINGQVITMENKTVHSAVAIQNNKIIAVGNDQQIIKTANAMTHIIDLEGKTVLPGFIDSHLHVLGYGFSFEAVDLFGVESQSELIDKCKDYIEKNNIPKGTWLLGRGFNQNDFKDTNDFPTAEQLNEISKEHPVLLLRTCGHIGITNELALSLGGVTKDTFVRGGSFDHYEDGRPNGVMREKSLEWFKEQIAKFRTVDDLKRSIVTAGKELLKYGVTSVHTEDSYDLGYSGDLSDIHEAYRQLIAEGNMPIRVYQKVSLPRKDDLMTFLEQPLRTGQGNDFFKMGPMKLWADSTIGARTAALLEDYADEANQRGILVYEDDELLDMIQTAHHHQMQVCIHTIGDAALEQVITSYEKSLEEDNPHRHRIVHCQIGNQDQYKRIGKLGISINIQPIQTMTDYPLIEQRLGTERIKTCHAWRSCIDANVLITGSSDVPCTYSADAADIFKSIAPIVDQRKWSKHEQVNVYEALEMYTVNAAISAFEENEKGTITPGKLADLAIVDKNPLDNNVVLEDISIVMTIVNGQVAYKL